MDTIAFTFRHQVTARLKEVNSKIIAVHCVAHRLALGVAQAATAVTYVPKYKRLQQQLFGFYSTAPVRAAVLREIRVCLQYM